MTRLALLFFLPLAALGQDFNPWNTQVGARGNLLGGAMGGRVPDNAMAYYNPADLAFVPQNSFSLNAALYTYGNLFMANALGPANSVSYDYTTYVPALFSSTWVGKKTGIRWNASYFNGGLTDINIRKFEDDGNGSTNAFQLRKYSREDWYTFGGALQLNEHLSVGLMPAVVSTALDYQRLLQTATLDTTLGTTSGYHDNISLYGYHLGVLLNAGMTLNYGGFVVGLNVKTPMLTLGAFSYLDYSRNTLDTRVTPGQDPVASYAADGVDFALKRPWDFSVFTERRLLGYLWTLRVGYLSATGEYMLSNEGSFASVGHSAPLMGTKSIWNVALGTEIFINENLGLLTSLRTDFNNLAENLYNSPHVVPAFSRWNMYHATLGAVYSNDKLMAEVGLRYSLAYQENLPALAGGVPGPPTGFTTFPDLNQTETMDVTSHQISLVLGLVFRFGNVQSLRITPPQNP